MHSINQRRPQAAAIRVLSVLTVSALLAAAVPRGATAALPPEGAYAGVTATTLAERATVAARQGQEWRTTLRSQLMALPQLRTSSAPAGPLAGLVVAGTLRLPATVRLAADTTIMATTVEFPGQRVVIDTQGHAVTFLPVDGVRWGTTGSGTATQAGSTLAGEIVINADGRAGATGQRGNNGSFGTNGLDGMPGEDIPAGGTCHGSAATHGQQGGTGESGGSGGSGSDGSTGGNGEQIVVDIPFGSQDRYRLMSQGGAGGSGGPGGPGGQGGTGGRGGSGGNNFEEGCAPGNGGTGGTGGNGGGGGNGGNGAGGGNGGQIFVSYPDGYDLSWITTLVSGGSPGGPGEGGSSGTPGQGGPGGEAGTNYGCPHEPCQLGNPGGQGQPGGFGGSGGPGNGSQTRGTDGTVTFNQFGATTVTANKAVYQIGDVPTYQVTGRPNTPILWSSWKNGVSTGEVDAYYGQNTDNSGRWTGQGPAWTANDVSDSWIKQVRIGDRTAQVGFKVIAPPPPDPWEGWRQLPGVPVTSEIGYSWSKPGLQIYARGTDNGLYTNSWVWVSGGAVWSGWSQMDGGITSAPVVIEREANKIEMFVRGTDGAIYRRVRVSGAWQGWQGLGGGSAGKPAAVSQNAAFAMVFIRGTDNQLYVNRLVVNTWTGWQSLGGTLTADPTAVATSNGNFVTVLTRGAGGEVNYRRWNGSSWGAWTTLGGWINGDLSAVSQDNTKIYLFVRGGITPYVNVFDGANWSGYQSLGGGLNSDPVAAPYRYAVGFPTYLNRVVTAGRGTDNRVYVNSAAVGEGFGGWRGIGGATTQPIALATDETTFVVFAINPATGVLNHYFGTY